MRKFVFFAAMFGVMIVATSFGLEVSISGTDRVGDKALIDFITNNIAGANITYGNYSNPANIPAGTELFVIGRRLSSSEYGNATNSATFNALEIPVICFTSYVARADGARWGWHDAGATGGWDVTGAETTVTAEGAGILGINPGMYDWFDTDGDLYYATGAGSIGEGHLFASLGGDILVAGWNKGETSGTGVAFGGPRLLYNLDETDSYVTVVPVGVGQQPLIDLINAIVASDSPWVNPYVSNPYPEHKATKVELNVTLGWDGIPAAEANQLDPSVIKYYVYIDKDTKDTDPNLYYDGQVVVTDWSSRAAAYDLSLSLDQDVNWQIEVGLDNGAGGAYAAGDPNNVRGPIWSFGSLRSIPVVPADQPDSVRAFPAEGAVFTVDFSSIAAPEIEWYKKGDTNILQTIGVTTENTAGVNWTTMLDLGMPVDVTDEGQYFCRVSNDGGMTWFDSGTGNLIIKRELAEYAFDGDLVDSSGNGAPTGSAMDSLGDPNTLSHVPGTVNYVDGADGTVSGALYLDLNEYIDFGVEGYPKANPVTTNGFGGGLDEGTIIYWIKPIVNNQQQTILGNFNDGSATGFLTLLQSDQDLRIYTREASGTGYINVEGRTDRPGYSLTDGNWHMMAACWSGAAGAIYVDGQQVLTGTGTAPTLYGAWQRGMLLGATRTSANRNFLSDMFRGGAIDNLRIYNYRLDADDNVEAFAQEYLDNTGIQPCVNMSFLDGLPNANFDNTGSSYCKVDLADFAVFVEAWLTDGLY